MEELQVPVLCHSLSQRHVFQTLQGVLEVSLSPSHSQFAALQASHPLLKMEKIKIQWRKSLLKIWTVLKFNQLTLELIFLQFNR